MGGFSSGSVVKNSPSNAGNARDMGLILGQEDPLEQETATQGQRSLGGLQSTEPQSQT